MAHTAGIAIADELKATFKSAKETGDIGFIEVGIDMVKHQLIFRGSGRSSGSAESDWEFIQKKCQPKQHTYFLVPSPAPNEDHRWILIHYAPDLSPVKMRMLYASNRNNLKEHIGPSDFSSDYFVSEARAVDLQVFNKSIGIGYEKIDVRTNAEMIRDDANLETRPQMTKSAVMAQLPINVLDSGIGVFKGFAGKSIPSGLLSLNTKNQDVEGEELQIDDADALGQVLPPDEPRYILFCFRHERNGIPTSKNIFVYYCPDAANRREKFTYSTCKQNILLSAEQIGVRVDLKLEIADRADINTRYFTRELYPVKDVKQNFSKPMAPGRRRKGRKKRGLAKGVVEF